MPFRAVPSRIRELAGDSQVQPATIAVFDSPWNSARVVPVRRGARGPAKAEDLGRRLERMDAKQAVLPDRFLAYEAAIAAGSASCAAV